MTIFSYTLVGAADCVPIATRNTCGIATSGHSIADTIHLACELDMQANNCAQFISENPKALAENKIKDCNLITQCSEPKNVGDHLRKCLTGWGQAWQDLATGIIKFLVGEGPSLDELTKARLSFLNDCTSANCKRQMLGAFASFFTKEEIEGHSVNVEGLDPKDPLNQNYLYGYSATVLYRKLLEKLKEMTAQGSMNLKFIEPWSGQEAQLPQSLTEMINSVLEKAGIKNTQCFKPEVVSEMRCYALFTVLDPLMAAGATAKLLKISGQSGKEIALLGKEISSSGKSLAKVKAIIEAFKKSNSVIIFDGPLVSSKGIELGTSYTAIIIDGKIVLGKNIPGRFNGPVGGAGSHIVLKQFATNRPLLSIDYEGFAGAVRFNLDGSIDISGYHLKADSQMAERRLSSFVRSIAPPETLIRSTPGRLSNLPPP